VLLVRFHLARSPRRGTGFQTGLAFAADRLHPAHQRAYGTLNHAGHGLIRVPLFQKRHCSAAARLQLLGCAFGSHKPNGDMGQSKYPFFMQGSVTYKAGTRSSSANRRAA
jgi:hypothetical protein